MTQLIRRINAIADAREINDRAAWGMAYLTAVEHFILMGRYG